MKAVISIWSRVDLPQVPTLGENKEVNIPGLSGFTSKPETFECICNGPLFNTVSLPQSTEHLVKSSNCEIPSFPYRLKNHLL